MRWASAVSEAFDTDTAISEAAQTIGAMDADLVVVFASAHHSDDYGRIPQIVASHFPGALVFGCSAGGVIGGGHEVEERAALSLTAASLPGVDLDLFHVAADGSTAYAFDDESPQLILLADPYSCDANALVNALDVEFPASSKVGGLASGGGGAGGNALFGGETVHTSGAICLAMTGNVELDTIIAQGCRPIGEPMLVTRCERNLILALNQKSPLEVLRDLFESLESRDRGLFRGSLFLGIEMRGEQVEKKQGDFLIRNLIGIDEDREALAVGARIEQWQAVQFHLRDAKTSAEDLESMLGQYLDAGESPAGALMFSCLGRGAHLYGHADHDTDLFARRLGPVPLGGFFCNGEIGPVGGTTFIHGYTSAFAMFRPKR